MGGLYLGSSYIDRAKPMENMDRLSRTGKAKKEQKPDILNHNFTVPNQ